MTDALVIIPIKPWLIEVWEPLPTKAPCPDKTQPYCCYWCTVIFYVRPYVVRPWHRFWIDSLGRRRAEKPGQNFEEWDRVETKFTGESLLEYNGEDFEALGGRVVWKNGRWWMKRTARRKQKRESTAAGT